MSSKEREVDDLPEVDLADAESAKDAQKADERGVASGDASKADEQPADDEPGAVSEEELAELKVKAAERDLFFDQLLRARADLENLQKRTRRERPWLEDQGARRVLGDVLEVVDNFERALDSLAQGGDADSLREGVEMIHSQLRQLLDKQGVEEIAAEGKPFDPEIHDAVAQCEVDDRPTGEVVGVLKKGYCHGDVVLRPATVQVAFNPGEKAGSSENDAGGDGAPAADSDDVSKEA